MTKEELISYIEEEQIALMKKADKDDERVFNAYTEYDEYVKKIIETDLTKEKLIDCFFELSTLYHIKSDSYHSVVEDRLSEEVNYDPQTKEELLNTLEHGIHSIEDFFLFQTYTSLSVHAGGIIHNAVDLKAKLEEVKEKLRKQEELGIVEEKKESEPPKTEEELERERISLLESIIGIQPEFNDIMGR